MRVGSFGILRLRLHETTYLDGSRLRPDSNRHVGIAADYGCLREGEGKPIGRPEVRRSMVP